MQQFPGPPGVSLVLLELPFRQKNAEATWRARILFKAEKEVNPEVQFSGLPFPLQLPSSYRASVTGPVFLSES